MATAAYPRYSNPRNAAKARRLRKQKRTKRIACMLLLVALWSMVSFNARCAGIRQEVLRLHVIANSDSEADQTAKLAVRDGLLQAGAALFDGSLTVAEAEAAVLPNTEKLEAAARKVLRRRGLDYGVRIEVGEYYFNTRIYSETETGDEEITLPAGRYRAVRVLLGDAKGRNWWCVMFPPLCLPAAERRQTSSLDAVLTRGQLRVVKANPRFEIRFKLVEIWESFRARLRGDDANAVSDI
ncbi:MAG: stage II sporulation protein R [Oscillospiraceae bacterium]|jgi:stage II sporulation protein R|nr:stage II sporulation protein R [Oscillospiraceae bacterium]